MKVTEIEQHYPEKTWVLAKVTKTNAVGEVEEVEPIYDSPERDVVYKKMQEVEAGTHVATFYTGPILKKGQAFSFIIYGTRNETL